MPKPNDDIILNKSNMVYRIVIPHTISAYYDKNKMTIVFTPMNGECWIFNLTDVDRCMEMSSKSIKKNVNNLLVKYMNTTRHIHIVDTNSMDVILESLGDIVASFNTTEYTNDQGYKKLVWKGKMSSILNKYYTKDAVYNTVRMHSAVDYIGPGYLYADIELECFGIDRNSVANDIVNSILLYITTTGMRVSVDYNSVYAKSRNKCNYFDDDNPLYEKLKAANINREVATYLVKILDRSSCHKSVLEARRKRKANCNGYYDYEF